MSTFIWGKIKLSNKCVINDMRIKNISVFFTEEKTDLFIVGLEENEVYFNIVCGYEGLSRSSWDKLHYYNCDDAFFSIGALRKTDDFSECLKKLLGRLLDLQHAIEEILRNDNVEGVFELNCGDGIRNKHVLLVDDVMTTGATVCSCAKELLKVEGVKLSVLTLAYSKQQLPR